MAAQECPIAAISPGISDESILPVDKPNKCRHIVRLLASFLATNNTIGLSPRFWPYQSVLHLDGHVPGAKFRLSGCYEQRSEFLEPRIHPGTASPAVFSTLPAKAVWHMLAVFAQPDPQPLGPNWSILLSFSGKLL